MIVTALMRTFTKQKARKMMRNLTKKMMNMNIDVHLMKEVYETFSMLNEILNKIIMNFWTVFLCKRTNLFQKPKCTM